MSLKTRVGQRKSFHAPVKANRKITIRIGRMEGSMMLRKMRKSPAPSISAASSISLGIPFMKLRTRKIFATFPKPGMMQDQYELIQPKVATMRYEGIMLTTPGNIEMSRRTKKSVSLPLKLIRE